VLVEYVVLELGPHILAAADLFALSNRNRIKDSDSTSWVRKCKTLVIILVMISQKE
jgi:hypothetical protein